MRGEFVFLQHIWPRKILFLNRFLPLYCIDNKPRPKLSSSVESMSLCGRSGYLIIHRSRKYFIIETQILDFHSSLPTQNTRALTCCRSDKQRRWKAGSLSVLWEGHVWYVTLQPRGWIHVSVRREHDNIVTYSVCLKKKCLLILKSLSTLLTNLPHKVLWCHWKTFWPHKEGWFLRKVLKIIRS